MIESNKFKYSFKRKANIFEKLWSRAEEHLATRELRRKKGHFRSLLASTKTAYTHTHMTGPSVSHVGERKTFSKMGWDRQKCAPRGVGKRAAIESLSSFTFQKTSRMYYSIKSFIKLLAEFCLKGGGFSTHTVSDCNIWSGFPTQIVC